MSSFLTGDGMANEDAVNFPDYGSEEGGHDTSWSMATTTLSSPGMDSGSTGLVVGLVLAGGCLLLLAAFLGRYMWKRAMGGKDTVDRPVISLPTLGTQYEISGLLSQENQWKSVGSLAEVDRPADDEQQAYGDLTRVSRYIDAGSVASIRETVKSESSLFQNGKGKKQVAPIIVTEFVETDGEMTLLDKRLGLSTPYLEGVAPLANLDTLPRTRPPSYLESSKEGEDVQRAWRSDHRGQRPFSDVIDQEHYASPNQARRLGGAKSELVVNSFPANAHSTTASAKSETHLSRPGGQPLLPQKIKPLLPPKQTINRSREDIEKVNKDILRISMAKNLQVIKDKENEDEDYDMPAGSYCPDEDYDEPPLCLSAADPQVPPADQQLPKIVFTPRAEYQEDYEDWEEESEQLPKKKWPLRAGLTASSEKIIIDQDYDDPVHSYQQY